MDEVITRIKETVIKLYPTILTDLQINEDYLEVMVNDVVDRALAFTKRDQLVRDYERDLIAYPDSSDTFWDNYYFPIPQRLETTLARVVVNSCRTIKSQNEGNKEVSSMSDNGQSVTYKEQLESFFSSSDDSKIFSDGFTLLSSYRIPKVITDENSSVF